jgi:Domain of unknown function (DUF4381)
VKPTLDLSGLHDFYQPPLPSWMPQTIGWYVLFGLLAALAAWLLYRAIRSWLANRYRREALRELQLAPVGAISEILKRAALTVWPRQPVAFLTGHAWLQFLKESSGMDEFRWKPGSQIEEVALARERPTPSLEQDLRRVASAWIRRHRVRI